MDHPHKKWAWDLKEDKALIQFIALNQDLQVSVGFCSLN